MILLHLFFTFFVVQSQWFGLPKHGLQRPDSVVGSPLGSSWRVVDVLREAGRRAWSVGPFLTGTTDGNILILRLWEHIEWGSFI